MESSTPYKGGEIDSRQAEAIDTLSSANEYQGQSRIQTLRKLPWNRKWKYFRDQLLARTVVIAAIVCVVVYIAVQILAPAPGPKLYVAVFDDAVGQQGAASLQSQVAKRLTCRKAARAECSSTPIFPTTRTASASCRP